MNSFSLITFNFRLLDGIYTGATYATGTTGEVGGGSFRALRRLFCHVAIYRGTLVSYGVVAPRYQIVTHLTIVP